MKFFPNLTNEYAFKNARSRNHNMKMTGFHKLKLKCSQNYTKISTQPATHPLPYETVAGNKLSVRKLAFS